MRGVIVIEYKCKRVEKERKAFEAAMEEAGNACKTYEHDLKVRRSVLQQKVAAFEVELNERRSQRVAKAAAVTDAQSRGDIEAALKAEDDLDALDEEIKALEKKCRLCSPNALKGAEELYFAAVRAYRKAADAESAYQAACRAASEEIRADIDRLESELEEVSPSSWGIYFPNLGGIATAFQRVKNSRSGTGEVPTGLGWRPTIPEDV